MQWINNEVTKLAPEKITIAEDMQDNAWLTDQTASGGAGFRAQWGAGFRNTLWGALLPPDDSGRDMRALAAVIAHRFNGDAFQRVNYTELHSAVAAANGTARVPTLISSASPEGFLPQKLSTLGMLVALTAPGIPMIFMGQEFLELGSWSDAVSLDWSKANRFAGILAFYRDMIRLRRNWFQTTGGLTGQNVIVYHVNNVDKIIAFRRWDRGGPGDDVVVVLNFAKRPWKDYTIGLPSEGPWRVRLNSDWRGYSSDFADTPSYDVIGEQGMKDGLAYHGSVGVGPYTAIVLSQDLTV